MARRLHKTLADYVVLAISPALIMVLVGSLVFFLIAVFYQGEHPVRLTWVMACFVFAAVLIGRISIEQGLERAMVFGVALAVVVGMALNSFLQFRGDWIGQFGWIINWGLIAVVWWSAHQLTWDCTVIDESQDASGEGLLQVAGLERPADQRNADGPATQAVEGTTARDVPDGWWQRYVEHQRRPHAPGVWVVYFSLAALPLYGFGQWFIPAANLAARRQAFWLLFLYVASGMGLLLTTSFLGLRRYLRQRRIEMPAPMAGLWLGMGAGIIVVLLVVSALLPRPSAEYSIAELPFTVGSPTAKSSRYAPIPREGVEDEQPGPAPADEDQPQAQPGSAASEGKQGTSREGQGQGKDATSGEARQSGQKGGDRSQENASQSRDNSESNPRDTLRQRLQQFHQQRDKPTGRPAKQRPSQDTDAPTDPSDEPPRDSERADQPPADESSSEARQQEQPGEPEPPEEPPSQNAAQQDDAQQDDAPDQPPDDQQAKQEPPAAAQSSEPSSSVEMPQPPAAPLGWLGPLLKWAFYLAFAVAVLYFLWRYRTEVLAALRDFVASLREFWSGLFGGRRARRRGDDQPQQITVPPAPFSTFADPFAAGVANRYPLEELVRYSFEAFEAWAREHGCQREPEQTPHELARDVARINVFIRAESRNMAELYSRVAYAEGELPDTTRDQLRQLWQVMRASAAEPR